MQYKGAFSATVASFKRGMLGIQGTLLSLTVSFSQAKHHRREPHFKKDMLYSNSACLHELGPSAVGSRII